jgi:hypothetical protein
MVLSLGEAGGGHEADCLPTYIAKVKNVCVELSYLIAVIFN